MKNEFWGFDPVSVFYQNTIGTQLYSSKTSETALDWI